MERSRVVHTALKVLLHVGAEHLVLGLDADEEGVIFGKYFVAAVLVTVHLVQDLKGSTKSVYKVARNMKE